MLPMWCKLLLNFICGQDPSTKRFHSLARSSNDQPARESRLKHSFIILMTIYLCALRKFTEPQKEAEGRRRPSARVREATERWILNCRIDYLPLIFCFEKKNQVSTEFMNWLFTSHFLFLKASPESGEYWIFELIICLSFSASKIRWILYFCIDYLPLILFQKASMKSREYWISKLIV